MNISILIPLFNEEESLEELFYRIDKVCKEHQYTYEVWFIDDGSTDHSWSIIENLKIQNPQIHGIKFSQNYGKSQALNAAFAKAKGEVVITMDADLQDFPEEIPELYNMVVKDNYDIVSGWKKKRYDNVMTKNLPSKLFNAAARRVSGVYLHDFSFLLTFFSVPSCVCAQVFYSDYWFDWFIYIHHYTIKKGPCLK